MARSSGGGSRSGGSHSSSGSSSGSRSRSRHSFVRSNSYFPGAKKFVYYRNGQANYIYSNKDLTKMKDAKPRWFLLLFYLPFIVFMLISWAGVIQFKQDPMETLSLRNVKIIDQADVFSDKEESKLYDTLEEFCETTGITTQIVTIDYDEWTDNGSLEDYSYYRYYAQFEDEDSWLLVYSEEDGGAGDWSWEGIQGDNTISTMDVFIDAFNTDLHSQLVVNQVPDPASAFDYAFNNAIDNFNNQSINVNFGQLVMSVFITIFICFHAGIMIFAGTNKKYSNKELVEIQEDGFVNSEQVIEMNRLDVLITCDYCGYKYKQGNDNRCPNCSALIQN